MQQPSFYHLNHQDVCAWQSTVSGSNATEPSTKEILEILMSFIGENSGRPTPRCIVATRPDEKATIPEKNETAPDTCM